MHETRINDDRDMTLPRVRRSLFFGVLFGLLLTPIPTSAQPAPDGPSWWGDFFNELRLGARVEGEMLNWSHTALPMANNNLRFLQRRIGADASFTTPTYGASVALRYRGAEVRASYRGNFGVSPTPRLTWQDGSPAIPLKPKIRETTIRGRYMITEWIGAGVKYVDQTVFLNQDYQADIQGQRASAGLFDGSVARTSVNLYVPLRLEWRSFTVFGSVGASVYGQSRQRYDTRFVYFDSNPQEPNQDKIREGALRTDYRQDSGMNRQFVRLGTSYRLGGATLRLSGSADRVDVPAVPADWHYGMRLEIGFPF